MKLIIILTRDVADQTEAAQLTQVVRNKLADHPEVKINAEVTEPVE